MNELNINSAILVGISLSGVISIKCAIDYPLRVDKLFLISSISIEGFPPFKKKNLISNTEERETDIKEIIRRSRKVEKNLMESNKEYIRMFY